MQQNTNSKSGANRGPSSSSSSSGTDVQHLWGFWSTMWNRVSDDPRVSRVLKSRVGQYLSSHPLLAFTAVLFSAMAAVPVGLFLTFALVTVIMSAVGFVFCEAALLFVAGLTLLSVLSGLAFFSIVVSVIINVFYFMYFNILKYNPLKKQSKVQEESEGETSGLGDTQ